VKVGSAEYFAPARRSAQTSQWPALGANVDLVVDGTLVNVRE
jgi:hypothetical protein